MSIQIKALEWWTSDTGDIIADSIVGRYRLGKVIANVHFRLETPSGLIDRSLRGYWPEAEAKAAAQADYEARILSAIDASPVPALTDEAVERAWEAFQNCPIDMCADHDSEQKKCLSFALLAAFPSKGGPDGE